jgi:hypothetical protein
MQIIIVACTDAHRYPTFVERDDVRLRVPDTATDYLELSRNRHAR